MKAARIKSLAVYTLCLLAPTVTVIAQTENVVYRFTGGDDGGVPYSTLIMDSRGDLYGTTQQYGGGPCTFPFTGCGTVFELEPSPEGWTYHVLYAFQGGEDGQAPSSVLTFDPKGNLYGTTLYGGIPQRGGYGTVFELEHTSSGWKEVVLYAFSGGGDGALPTAGLVLDDSGNVYGTTTSGGNIDCSLGPGCGVVFRLTHSTGGWSETVLHAFGGSDGAGPHEAVTLIPKGASPLLGPVGTIYGTTMYGGNGSPYDFSGGVVFRLVPVGETWVYRTVYEFPSDLGNPGGPLIFDEHGNIYGMDGNGGEYGEGAVFELFPVASGTLGAWRERDIYQFSGIDGSFALNQGVVMDGSGNLYGTTLSGGTGTGCLAGCGTVFRLSKSGDDWYESGLYSFPGGVDGWELFSGIVLDNRSYVYGMTVIGGDLSCAGYEAGCGLVYEIIP